jgi:hypothetical protein
MRNGGAGNPATAAPRTLQASVPGKGSDAAVSRAHLPRCLRAHRPEGVKEERAEGLAERTLRDGPVPRTSAVQGLEQSRHKSGCDESRAHQLVYPALAKGSASAVGRNWRPSKSALDLLLLNFNVRCRSGRRPYRSRTSAAEAIPGISCRRSAAVRKHDLLWSADMWILLSEAPQPLGGLE